MKDLIDLIDVQNEINEYGVGKDLVLLLQDGGAEDFPQIVFSILKEYLISAGYLVDITRAQKGYLMQIFVTLEKNRQVFRFNHPNSVTALMECAERALFVEWAKTH